MQVPTRVRECKVLRLDRGLDEVQDREGSLDSERKMHVGGSTTWRLPLNTTGVKVPQQPDFVIERATFTIHWAPGSTEERMGPDPPDWNSVQRTLNYTIFGHVFSSHVLRYQYLFAKYGDLIDIGRHMERLTAAQLFKLNADDRDKLLQNFWAAHMFLYRMEFDKPQSW